METATLFLQLKWVAGGSCSGAFIVGTKKWMRFARTGHLGRFGGQCVVVGGRGGGGSGTCQAVFSNWGLGGGVSEVVLA